MKKKELQEQRARELIRFLKRKHGGGRVAIIEPDMPEADPPTQAEVDYLVRRLPKPRIERFARMAAAGALQRCDGKMNLVTEYLGISPKSTLSKKLRGRK